jgi:hypothetical protein
MEIHWNLMQRRKRFEKSDILILSVAKSGRTWLRVLVNKYLSLAYDIPFDLNDLSKSDDRIPSIHFTHELWEHYSKATSLQRLLGKYIVPANILRSKKVLVLYRDPRDVLVSLFFQKTKRSKHKTGKDMAGFISDKRHGIDLIVRVMNHWRTRLETHPDVFWISYEALKQDCTKTLMEIVRFMNLSIIREDMTQGAVDFAKFENMKKMEAKGVLDNRIMRPGDPSDPDSFKVRKGKVGDYVNHFSSKDLILLDRAVVDLDPFFGYQPVKGIS